VKTLRPRRSAPPSRRGGELASARVAAADGNVVIEVSDDGVGGADPTAGSGLRGLADRVEALGGSLEIISPAGAGTALRADIPHR
jgi:signal transduction histidine kinase